MSVTIKYKGNTIASANTDTTKTLQTSGKYCEDDITIENVQDGGITPTGNINITDTNVTDVTNYATATVVDADLVAENIKKDVNILGVVGSFEGGGGGLPSKITAINAGIVTWAQNYTANSDHPNCAKIAHGLSTTPNFAMCYAIDGYPLDAACRIASWTNNAGAKNVAFGVYQAANGNLSSTANNWNIIRIDAVNLNVGAYSAFPITSGTRMIWIAAVLDLT